VGDDGGDAMTEPAAPGLRLHHDHELALTVSFRGRPLFRYVYQPWDAQLESPRPYLHPVRTLGGDVVSLYRPHDHVWHKGVAWSLPNVGPENFWGGSTYTRGRGYEQLANNGSMRHDGFERLAATPDLVSVRHRLDWLTQAGQSWFRETRSLTVVVDAGVDAWVLGFATRMRNVSGHEIVIGSPTTQGRDNAGYGGLFWRGPRSFTGGRVYLPGIGGADELMGVRAPWMGFCGRHDEHGGASTLVFVDAPDNPGHPTQWFVRSEMYACLCPAPFFSEEVRMPPDDTLTLRYALVVADGDREPAGAELLAQAGLAALSTLDISPALEAPA
jgi:hypothetical protein